MRPPFRRPLLVRNDPPSFLIHSTPLDPFNPSPNTPSLLVQEVHAVNHARHWKQYLLKCAAPIDFPWLPSPRCVPAVGANPSTLFPHAPRPFLALLHQFFVQ